MHHLQQPTVNPSKLDLRPSGQPTMQPSKQPTTEPTMQPSQQPSSHPTAVPSISQSPTPGATAYPTVQPSSPHWALHSSITFYFGDIDSGQTVISYAGANVKKFLETSSYCDPYGTPPCTVTVDDAISSRGSMAPTAAPTAFSDSPYVPAVALHHIYKFNGSVFFAINGGVGAPSTQTGYYTAYPNTMCFYNDLTSYSSPFATPASCQRLCDATPGCVGVIYGSCPTGNTCYDVNYYYYGYNGYKACWLKNAVDPASCSFSDPMTGYFGVVTAYAKPASHNIVQDTLFASSTVTISMFITTTQSNVALMSLGCSTTPGTVQGAFILYIDDSGYIGFGEMSDSLGFGLYGSGTKTVNNGHRTHVAFVKSVGDGTNHGSVGTFYVNGSYAGTMYSFIKTAISAYTDVQLVLGNEYCGFFGGVPFNGTMQDVMMFPSSFNADQVGIIRAFSCPRPLLLN